MSIYINYNGKKIKGNVTAKGYEDCIEAQSFSFGIGRGISMEAGHIANREASRPSISEITLVKQMDASSGGLFKESVTGTEGVTVTIDIVQTGGKELTKNVQYTLSDCLVSSYSVNADGGDSLPTESVSISFSKIEADLSHSDKTNKNSGTMKVHYDLTTATAG